MNALLSVSILWHVLFLTFNLGSVSISSSPSQANAGGTAALNLTYSPTPASPVSSTITLTCPNVGNYSYDASGTSINFPVPLNLYGSSCTFSVTAADFALNNTASVIIKQQMAFTSPANNAVISINNPISVGISTGSVNVSAIVTLQFACTNYAPAIPTFNIITSSYLPYSYSSYPSTAYGPCTLKVVGGPNFLIPPSTLSLSLKYSLSIASPSIIFNGQNFTTTISCSVTPVITNVTLLLIYTSAGISYLSSSYSSVLINQQVTLTPPNTLAVGTLSYSLRVSANANFNPATSPTFSAANVQLRFAQPPAGVTYNYPYSFPILINSANVTNILPSNQQINVTLSCGGRSITTFPITIGNQINYANPNSGIGLCTLSASNPTSYLLAPSSVALTLSGTVSISSSPASAVAGGTAVIGLAYVPSPSSAVSSTITLTCPNVGNYSYGASGTSINFPVPSNLYGSSCTFSVATSYYVSSSTSSIIITQQLAFTSPTNNDVITINNPISVGMSTGSVNVSASVVLQFACINYAPSIPTFTIITSSYLPYSYSSYPSEAYGPCTLSVSSAPDYLVSPNPLSLSLKYSLTITSPSPMYIGQQFLVTVSSSVTPVVNTVSLNLVFDPTDTSPTIVQSYSGIVIYQQTTLVAPTTLAPGSGYTLQVAADDNFNSATSSPFSASNVQLRFAQPPSGCTYVYPEAIPILIDSADVASILPSGQSVSVTLSCGSSEFDSLSVIIGTQTAYTNSYEAIGDCSFSATSSVSYLTSPSPVSVIIKGTVALSPVVSSVSAGGTVQLGLTYDPLATDVSSSVVLTCPNLNPSTTAVTGTTPTVSVPAGFYGAPCVFSVISQYYNSNNTVNTIVTQILSFSSPTISTSLITIDAPIPIIVSTSPNTTISETINLKLNCSAPSNMTDQYFDILTSGTNATNYQYPTTAFGNCALSVNSAPSFFVLPSDALNITLQYNLTIDAPAKVFPNEPFLVTATCPQTPGVDTATLNLIYTANVQKSIFNTPNAFNKRYTAGYSVAETTMQSYNVTINQPAALLAPGDLVIGTSYVLELVTSSAMNSSTSPTITAALLQNLMVIVPASVLFGQPVSLKVDTDGPMPTKYTAYFACPFGSFEINALTTGVTYNVVPPGIYGRVVITATAERATPGFYTMQIVKPPENIPAIFIPGILPHQPSIFVNGTNFQNDTILV